MKRAYAIILRTHTDEFCGVYAVVDTMAEADAMCEALLNSEYREFEHATWVPTFYDGED